MKSILRAALVALAFAAGVPRTAAAQLDFEDIRWGQSRADVLALFRGTGYELREDDGGQLYFFADGRPTAVAILDPQRRLVAVMLSTDGPADEVREIMDGVTDNLGERFGPPTSASAGMTTQYWSIGEQGVTVMVSGPTRGSAQSTLSVLYNGPGWEAVRDAQPNGPAPRSGLAPLDATRWIVGFQGSGRRVSIDRTRVTALGNDVFRVWERWEAEEPVQDNDGDWYDANLTHTDYDCRGLRMRVLEIHTYSRGEVVDTARFPSSMQTWTSVVPESIGEITLRAACPVLRTLG